MSWAEMQMRENKGFFSFAFDSAHVKYGVWTWPKNSMCVAIFRKLSAGQHKILSSVTVIKKFTSFLLSYFKSVVLWHLTGEILGQIQAKIRRRTSHEPNRMQMRKILCSPSFAFQLGSCEVRRLNLALSFEFHPKAFFWVPERISRSAIIHVQNWPTGLQRVGWRIRWRQRHTSLKLQRVNAAYCTCKTLKVRKPRAAY